MRLLLAGVAEKVFGGLAGEHRRPRESPQNLEQVAVVVGPKADLSLRV
jgi:hypothetical protein